MGVIAYNEEDVKLLARLMRAEAEGEGQQGMLMVGNVGVNRVRGNCLDFKKYVIYVKWCIKILVVLRQRKRIFLSTCKRTGYRFSKANDSRTTFLACKFCLMVLDLKALVHQLGIINKTLVASKALLLPAIWRGLS